MDHTRSKLTLKLVEDSAEKRAKLKELLKRDVSEAET
jgi:hypothetical protein